jgi:hypothetical protein
VAAISICSVLTSICVTKRRYFGPRAPESSPTSVREFEFGQSPAGAGYVEQQLALKRATSPKTNITLGGNKYAENVGGKMGESDVEKYQFAQTIPAALAKVNETIGVLKKSDINTGLGAHIKTIYSTAVIIPTTGSALMHINVITLNAIQTTIVDVKVLT